MPDICRNCKNKSKAAGKLDQKELERLGHNCQRVIFQKNERIMIQNAPSYAIVFIQKGLVKVHAMGPEKEQILRIVKGPAYLGIPTTVVAKINQYSVTALSKTNVCFIGFAIFNEFVTNNSAFAYEIIVELCKSELYNYKRCINQLQKQSSGKLAEALLYFSEEIFNAKNFKLPLTRNELGDLTCNSRETISRILSDFSANKIIKIKKNFISILDKEQLERISKIG